MVRGLGRLAFGGLLLLVLMVSTAWYAVAGLVAALVSWPGLIGVGLLAVVAARAATDPRRTTKKEMD